MGAGESPHPCVPPSASALLFMDRLDRGADRRTPRLRRDGRVIRRSVVARLIVAVRDRREACRRVDRDAEVVVQVPIAGAGDTALAHPALFWAVVGGVA